MIRELIKEELNDAFFDLNYEGFLYHYNHRKDIFKKKTKEELKEFFLENVDKGLKVLGLFKEDKLIGFLSYEIKEMATKYMWVDEFFVAESERRKGYGTLLMNKAKEIAEKEKVKRIALNVFDFNKGAMKLYKNLGYSEQRHTLELFLED